ncbi:MAG: putative ABC transporter permease [Clostridia bacterium]|nr:putative ABC transporter permease [Clostridia bacterium]
MDDDNNSVNQVFAKGFNFYKVFWIFMLGCFLGDVHEVALHFLKHGEFVVRRGVIYGPLNPVYGFGAALFFIAMYRMKNSTHIFLIGGIIGGTFEYLCSFIQEHVFGTISWDYSNYFLNIEGRTSIFHIICWGLLAILFVKYVMPFAERTIEKLPKKFGTVFTWCVVVFMIFDMAISAIASRRQFERHEGYLPRNYFEQKIDEIYTDERLKMVYQNTMEVKK